MAFSFRLQFALERARANEALARSVIVDARLVFDETGALLAGVESRIAEVRSAALGGSGPAASTLAGNVAAAEAAAIALCVLRSRRLGEVERARIVLGRARDVYARAAAARSTLERLRERRFREFCELREAAEAAEMDELGGIAKNTERIAAVDEPGRAAAVDEAPRAAFRTFTA